MRKKRVVLCAPCLFGLESILSSEIRRIGGENLSVADGRVTFEGDLSLIARANICLRTAERVCIVLGAFEATSFAELFDQAVELPLEEYVGKADAFPVTGWSLKSRLRSVPDCQSIIKKALASRMEHVYSQSWFEETGPVRQVRFTILKDEVTIMLDTSGSGLHKRGYRQNATEAPIKETLAAGIADLARVDTESLVIDPMCGSGTLLIEAALYAYHIPPGVRRRFAAEDWNCLSGEMWQVEREAALEKLKKKISFTAQGWDIDPQAVTLTGENAAKAGLGKKVTAQPGNLADLCLDGEEKAVILCNPPYGERLLEIRQAEQLYRTMGRVFPRREGLRYYIISPHEKFEELFGRPADRRRKLYNGMIKCQLFMYFK